MKTKLSIILLLPLILNGCVTKGWKGLLPDKDVEMINPIITLMTPYGQQTIRADRIATRVNPMGTNAVGPQALPALVAPQTNAPTVWVLTNAPVLIPAQRP